MEVPVPPLLTDNCPVKPGVKVCTPPADETVKVILASVPVAKVCVAWVWPFKEVMAPDAEAQFVQVRPLADVELATRQRPLDPTG